MLNKYVGSRFNVDLSVIIGLFLFSCAVHFRKKDDVLF